MPRKQSEQKKKAPRASIRTVGYGKDGSRIVIGPKEIKLYSGPRPKDKRKRRKAA